MLRTKPSAGSVDKPRKRPKPAEKSERQPEAEDEAEEVGEGNQGEGKDPIAEEAAADKVAITLEDEDEDESLPTWMRNANARDIKPETPATDSIGLHPHLVATLTRMGLERVFPVQATVVPLVLAAHEARCPSDLCVSAPTGSGKTLAYALPIVNTLLARVVPRLRALVIVPTRGLASQVHGIFSSLCAGSRVRVGLAAGQGDTSWEDERLAIVGPRHWGGDDAVSAGGRSAVDVLVATPGRLVEHLQAGGGFTLQHLSFLVLDEADRLLSQDYQGWLSQVLEAAHERPPDATLLPGGGAGGGLAAGIVVDPLTRRQMAGSWQALARGPTWSGGGGGGAGPTPLLKLLFSATLTKNPGTLAPLRLVRPRFLSVGGARLATPATLQEWSLTCAQSEKPALLLLLLRWLLRGRPDGEQRWDWGGVEGEEGDEGEEGEEGEEGDEFGEGDAIGEEDFGGDDDDDEDAIGRAFAEGEEGEEGEEGKEMVTGPTAHKSAVLPQTIVFTSSVESTQRLARLLQLLDFECAASTRT
eukprot:7381706-Prymnesium_polylepis.2